MFALLLLACAPPEPPPPPPRKPKLTGYRAPDLVVRKADASLEDLSAGWWRWVLAYPRSTSPVSDMFGQRCAQGQRDDVWFLVGPQGADASRSCAIPENKTLLIPALNCASASNGCMQELAALQYKVLLDGTEVAPVMQDPTIVHGDAVADNPFTAQSDAHPVEIAAEGAWVKIPPLYGGEHTLVVQVTGASTYTVTYTLQVDGPPAPETTSGTDTTTTTDPAAMPTPAPAATASPG